MCSSDLLAHNRYIGLLLADSEPEEALAQTEQVLDWMFAGKSWQTSDGRLASDVRDRVNFNDGEGAGAEQMVASTLFLRSLAFEGIGKTKDAVWCLKLSERLDGRNGDVLAALGDYYLPSDRKLAIQYYERSVSVDDKDWKHLRRLGQQYAEDGRLIEARDLYRRAVRRAPFASVAWIELAHILRAQKDYKSALDALMEARRGINFDPEGVDREIAELKQKLGLSKD